MECFYEYNDIGWVFLNIGYFTFEETTEIVRCQVKDENGLLTNEYFSCVNGQNEKIYYDANDKLYDGEILSNLPLY